ncbi:hypothetical protein DL96DRAFT_1639302 [Flagelloscypha sp. PMI_526]|nr:hypothetical protein DL96DRAFT_1639302 [Flagelloscypha sp. PMI_526]
MRRQFVFHSPIFRDMFAIGPKKDKIAEGDTEENLIILEDIRLEDFVSLLKFFYRDISDFQDSKAEWISILKLAHKWQMDRVQKEAVMRLGQMTFADPFEKIGLCERFDIGFEWVHEEIEIVAERDQNVKVSDGRDLSRDLFAAILFLRQKKKIPTTLRSRSLSPYRSPSPDQRGRIPETNWAEELRKALCT